MYIIAHKQKEKPAIKSSRYIHEVMIIEIQTHNHNVAPILAAVQGFDPYVVVSSSFMHSSCPTYCSHLA
jgi:hypothetical protein